ncbi:MAG: hypothetical protein ABFE08_05010 [Armatimonadia bacterium]
MAEVKAIITGERSGGTNRIVAYTILADGVEIYREETTVDGLTSDAEATEVVRQLAEVRAQQVLAVVRAVETQPLKGVEIPLKEATKATLDATPTKEG